MKYYVIEIVKGDSKVAGKGVYEFDSLHDAEASFHSKVGTAMKSELYDEATICVISTEGGVYFSKHFIRPSAE